MKNLLLLLMLLSLKIYAQDNKAYLKQDVTIRPTRVISSSEGRSVNPEPLFKVYKAKDRSLKNCIVYAQVIESRKSNLSGSKGRMIIRPLYILDNNGNKISVYGDIFLRGLNRANVKMIFFFIPFMWFVPGGGVKTDSDEFHIYYDEYPE